MSVKVAFMQLSSCWGCHQSLLNAHLGLLPVLPELEIVYWPAVIDAKLESLKSRADEEIDLGIVEGAVRTTKDLELLRIMREKCKIISTFGTCACQGGVIAMANNFPLKELIKRKFGDAESITNENLKEPKNNLPGFEVSVKGIDDCINIDAYFVGCPPRTEAIVSNILSLLGKKSFPMTNDPYCNECILNDSGCLLDSNILCFGPITSSGCTTRCTSNNLSCVGCRGPSNNLSPKAEKLKDIINDLDHLNDSNLKILHEFYPLFLNQPMLANFLLVGPKIPQMPSETEEITVKIVDFLRFKRFPKRLKLSSDFILLSSVCDTCGRIRGRMTMTRVKRDYEGLPNEEDCFIEQGYICLGPRTNAGCGAQCINANAPCTGCYAPIDYGFKHGRYREDAWAEIAVKEFNVALSKAELLSQIKDHIGTFEKFSLAKNPQYKEGYKGKLTGQWWLEQKD
ncbi:MAG: NADH-quinone oxidoreductase subunit B family protein [Promethearchaeota archaeon]|jgi:coenzyme F420-reducing hydrogenase gamma subunit